MSSSIFVGSTSIKGNPFSMSQLLYVREQLRMRACTKKPTRVVLFSEVAVMSETIRAKQTEKDGVLSRSSI